MKSLAIIAALAAAPAMAEECAPHEVVTMFLANQHGEARQAVGMIADAAFIEIYANEATGTWSILLTEPGGPTCIVAFGDYWQAVDEPLPPLGEDG